MENPAMPSEESCELFYDVIDLLHPDIVTRLGDEKLQKLHESYSEPWKNYHTWKHIKQLLEWIEEIKAWLGPQMYVEIQLIALYHDAYFLVGNNGEMNEALSEAWARKDLTDIFCDQLVTMVCIAIESTNGHRIPQGYHLGHGEGTVINTFLDLDLRTLASDPMEFAANSELIWLEQQPVCNRNEFTARRQLWAKKMLSKEVIFQTKQFAHLEEQARENLQTLLTEE